MHGSEGKWSGWSYRNATILAAHGFLAVPFGYSNGGNSWNAGDITDVPLDRTVEALASLRASDLSGDRIGVYGASRGAEHALLLTSLMVRDGIAGYPDAIAVHSAPDVICGAFNARSWRDSGDPGWQPWDPAKRAWTWHGSSDDLLPTTPIEIERYEGPLLLSHGTEDTVWSVEMTRCLRDRLERHGRTPEVHFYEGEGHGFGSFSENQHYEWLVDFFARHLGYAAWIFCPPRPTSVREEDSGRHFPARQEVHSPVVAKKRILRDCLFRAAWCHEHRRGRRDFRGNRVDQSGGG